MDYITRINLNTDCGDNRAQLIDFCLMKEKQYMAIGWSCSYSFKKVTMFSDYKSFYDSTWEYIKSNKGRINPALNLFNDVKKDDLFWTRDLQGFYWICRAKDVAEPMLKEELDVGAVVPVEAFRYGLEAPGEIKASFNRANGGIVQKIYTPLMINYSKHIFNSLKNENYYSDIDKTEGDIIANLPDFDLEELVISYIQIAKDYYLLSNSIANKSTTPLIEGEFVSRDIDNPLRAVVQVKGEKKEIYTDEYKAYLDAGYRVYLYSGKEIIGTTDGFDIITKDELRDFYTKYKAILPESITKWEKLF